MARTPITNWSYYNLHGNPPQYSTPGKTLDEICLYMVKTIKDVIDKSRKLPSIAQMASTADGHFLVLQILPTFRQLARMRVPHGAVNPGNWITQRTITYPIFHSIHVILCLFNVFFSCLHRLRKSIHVGLNIKRVAALTNLSTMLMPTGRGHVWQK